MELVGVIKITTGIYNGKTPYTEFKMMDGSKITIKHDNPIGIVIHDWTDDLDGGPIDVIYHIGVNV